ncbi:MAG: acyloxyacyl hydrolase [Luminiphilus sp.]|jgi:lipid A 3-O-deacylase|nr:acyloxyacyl hydrolase [Luminiphilus sp.]MDG1461319.1 acyloxyacyl hydrolase [Luminiphilus sp.]
MLLLQSGDFSWQSLVKIGMLLLFVCSAPATRGDWVSGVTTDTETDGIGGIVEYHWQEFATAGKFSANIAIAGRLDDDSDAWAGAGVAGKYRIGRRFFIEGSFMPGFYHAGDTELGGSLHFRSLIGAGFNINENAAISLTIDHMSNGSTQTLNPGSDAISLRFTFR